MSAARPLSFHAVVGPHASRFFLMLHTVEVAFIAGHVGRIVRRRLSYDCALLLGIMQMKRNKIFYSKERTGTTYARHLMQEYLGRKLAKNEHVHHRNGDITDDRLENLEVLSQKDHEKWHHPDVKVVCKWCGTPFVKTAKQMSGYRKNVRRGGGKGHFCSRSCVGQYANYRRWN